VYCGNFFEEAGFPRTSTALRPHWNSDVTLCGRLPLQLLQQLACAWLAFTCSLFHWLYTD